MRYLLAILLVLLMLPIASDAQILPFRTYSIENGLSESVANDMLQDADGYIWVATGYGLNRFDGHNFRNYFEENGLLNNKIQSLYQDREGRLWIGTNGGVNVFERDSIRTREVLNPLRRSTILEIFEDSQGEYWFATDGQGVWHLDGAEQLTQYSTVHGLVNDRVRDIIEDGEGTLWFGTRGGLTQLKNGNFRSFTVKQGLPEDKIRDLQSGLHGDLWIATRGGLSHYRDGRFRNYTEEDGLINNRIQSLSLDEKGGLWIGTEEGASFFDGSLFRNYSVKQGLSNNIIYSTLYDREQNIWFGTFGGGISVFLGEQFKNYSVEEGLPNNVITSITQDSDGTYWVTTYGGGMARYDGSSFEIIGERDGLVDNKVYTSLVGSDGKLYIGTRWGLSIYDGRQFQNFDETELPYRKIRAIAERPDEDEFWLGTYGEGVLRYRNGTFTLLSEEDGLAHNTVMSVEVDDRGAVWFATYGGVSRYKNGTFTNFTIRDGLPSNGILDILKDNSGSLWISSFGGLARYNGETFEPITTANGLPDEVCYFILQDANDLYWIGTNKGVVRFNYDKYRASEVAEERVASFKLLTQDQGLIANEMNAGAGYVDRSGKLWFGSVGGLTQFDPELDRTNPVAPKVHIQEVWISGESVVDKRSLEVGSDNRNITVGFVGISFTAPEQIVYEYRLRGSGESWQHTRQRSVRYSALLPGDYSFQVRARSNDGVWSDRASLDFTVLAPFWMQWWFIILVLLVLSGVVAFIYHYYRIKKMVEIERMRVRIASDLHDDVGSSLTEIALQSDFLQTADIREDIKQSLSQIGEQSRKVVNSLDDIVWSIDARNDTLGDLTDRMQDYVNNVLSNKKVSYHFEDLNMSEKLTVPIKENIYLIFKEAVNNIAKHSNADRVDIELSNNNGSFEMIISDNGRGNKPVKRSGHGLRNMKMRANRIDADINFTNDTGFTVHVQKN